MLSNQLASEYESVSNTPLDAQEIRTPGGKLLLCSTIIAPLQYYNSRFPSRALQGELVGIHHALSFGDIGASHRKQQQRDVNIAHRACFLAF